MRPALLLLALLLVPSLKAQDPTMVPGLRAKLLTTTSDTARAQILSLLCFHLTRSQPDSARMFGDQALVLAQRAKNDRALADAYNNLGWLAASQGDLTRADSLLPKALALFQHVGNPAFVSVTYSNMGWLADMKGDRVGALKLFQEALKMSESVKDTGNTAVLLYNIGTTYNKMDEFGRARDMFQRSYEQEGSLHRPDKQAMCLMGIGNTFRSEGDTAKALSYYDQALTLYTQLNDHLGCGLIAENTGALYDRKDPPLAVAYYRKALAHYQRMHSGTDQAYVLLSMGSVQLEMGQLAKADSSFTAGALLAAASGDPELVMDYEKYLARLASAMGDSKGTFAHFERYTALKDSLHNVSSDNELLRLRTAFETERAEKDNELLRATDLEKTERLQRRSLQLYGSLALALLALGAVLLVWRNLRQKRRHAAVLEKLNAELNDRKERIEEINRLLQLKVLRTQMNPHFIYNSLNAIHNLVRKGEALAASAYLDGFARLLRMVLDHSVKERVPLADEIAFLRQYLKLEALRFEDGLACTVDADRELLDDGDLLVPTLLIQPFVENAIWHGLAPKQGVKKLSIRFTEREGRLTCSVEDNGVGRAAAPKREHPDGSSSMGLQLTNERLQLLAYQLQGPGRILFTDLETDGVPSGTRVDIVLGTPG